MPRTISQSADSQLHAEEITRHIQRAGPIDLVADLRKPMGFDCETVRLAYCNIAYGAARFRASGTGCLATMAPCT